MGQRCNRRAGVHRTLSVTGAVLPNVADALRHTHIGQHVESCPFPRLPHRVANVH
jgi:aminoglycoside phosphotransferase